MRPRPDAPTKIKRPATPEKLFTQVIAAAEPALLKLWEEGGNLIPAAGTRCEGEIAYDKKVGRSYYNCNPHFWQCYWQNGLETNPSLKIDLFGQTYHVVARTLTDDRYYQLSQHGYQVELAVQEIPGVTQSVLLADSCRDTYLPERIYGYGQVAKGSQDGFIWDNFGRRIFIDRFYVTHRRVNEWRVLTGKTKQLELDRKKWPMPALLNRQEQINYCAFYGKRLLEAKLFDAASMTPADFKNPTPARILRPATPWQRDLRRTFLGMSRLNPDYELSPLDCQLAEVQGCPESYFSTDSATWMGLNYSLGFYPESLKNNIEPEKNLKMSSRFFAADSTWHELGKLSKWNGIQEKLPVAFRCYEEVVE